MNAPVLQQPILRDGHATLPGLFRHRVHEMGERVAMREKEFGIWKPISWNEYGRRARALGLGLVSLGLQRGDVVSILSENNKEWIYTDVGAICAGGVACGIYPTDSANQLDYIVNNSATKFLFVENEEQLDKYLAIRDRVPSLAKVVVYDMEGLRDFADPMVIPIDRLYELGAAYDKAHPEEWDKRIDAAEPEDLMILIYTSGTTGPPKGAMLSHRNVIFQMSASEYVLEVHEGDEQICFLPLCHIAERSFSVHRPLASKSIINFVESPETFAENLREVSPTIMFAVPRIWERFYSAIAIQLKDATWIGRLAYAWAIGVGRKRADHTMDGRRPPAALDLVYRFANWLVLRNVKRVLGLDRARWIVTGAAPIAPDLIRWYFALGIDMFEVYGQTENCGVATGTNPKSLKIGTVGVAAPGTEVKLSPEGEILLKGPHVFIGYLNQPDKTAETVKDGWLHTGDVGVIDNQGFVRITDRMKDIIITAGGKNITPSEIENQLKFSPYISDAVVIGDRRKFLTALIMIDHDNVAKFAQDKGVPFSNYASLCRAQEVQDLIGGEIDKVNRQFARVETIKKFRLIDTLLTAEDEELTPTMKLKRKLVNKKYAPLIDSMYKEG
ncbi:MAG: AMP-binding protein [Candidatus Odyssella sp.]|nr:AMP-binding protein [Candidatus Odyssella sp.]